jgi:hypothetical protein
MAYNASPSRRQKDRMHKAIKLREVMLNRNLGKGDQVNTASIHDRFNR